MGALLEWHLSDSESAWNFAFKFVWQDDYFAYDGNTYRKTIWDQSIFPVFGGQFKLKSGQRVTVLGIFSKVTRGAGPLYIMK